MIPRAGNSNLGVQAWIRPESAVYDQQSEKLRIALGVKRGGRSRQASIVEFAMVSAQAPLVSSNLPAALASSPQTFSPHLTHRSLVGVSIYTHDVFRPSSFDTTCALNHGCDQTRYSGECMRVPRPPQRAFHYESCSRSRGAPGRSR